MRRARAGARRPPARPPPPPAASAAAARTAAAAAASTGGRPRCRGGRRRCGGGWSGARRSDFTDASSLRQRRSDRSYSKRAHSHQALSLATESVARGRPALSRRAHSLPPFNRNSSRAHVCLSIFCRAGRGSRGCGSACRQTGILRREWVENRQAFVLEQLPVSLLNW